MRPRSRLALLLTLSTAPLPAFGAEADRAAAAPEQAADEPSPGPDGKDAVEDDEDLPSARPPAEDLRAGHWLLGLGVSAVAPSNDVVPQLPGLGSLTYGVGPRAMVGYGISRTVFVRIDGGFHWLSGADVCAGCSATSFDVGAGFAYHVTQAIAVDPWIAYGVAYRHSLATAAGQEDSFSGIDFLRIALGADFYPSASLGFGPYIELDVGVRTDEQAPAYDLFQGGLRFIFDPVRGGTAIRPNIARH